MTARPDAVAPAERPPPRSEAMVRDAAQAQGPASVRPPTLAQVRAATELAWGIDLGESGTHRRQDRQRCQNGEVRQDRGPA